MELLAEILFDVYAALMLPVIPEKAMSKKYVILSKVIAAILLSFAQIITGIVLFKKHH